MESNYLPVFLQVAFRSLEIEEVYVSSKPRVSLVGAGPGDPELLTIKALRCLEQADVVVYDRLVAPEILEFVRPGAKLVYVGKSTGKHHMPQKEINALLIKLARTGRYIVRLKGGDPFVFGRGSEEVQHLACHGISFEVVPGITAATACSTYAGIPLTHRGIARSVRFVTGHCRADEPLDLDWQSLADEQTTLVFYMGLATLSQVTRKLVEAGLSADMPAAVVENGTTRQQRCFVSTLDQLAQLVSTMDIAPPALVIIGHVVKFADELDWFSQQQYEKDTVCMHQVV